MIKKIRLFFKNRISSMHNEGSVLVTVLISFMFVSILVAIIMSTSVVNFKVRSIDRNTKNEFYYAEKALNDIYAGIGLETTKITGDLYNKVLTYKEGKDSYNAENEYDTIRRFNEKYKDKIVSMCDKDKLSKYLTASSRAHARIVSDPEIYYRYEKDIKAADNNYYKAVVTVDEDEFPSDPSFSYDRFKAVVIKNLSITSKNSSTGYVSTITTDIVVGTPMVDFVTVNKRGLDYAVIANDGIYFNGNTEIEGNVYGGAYVAPGTPGTVEGGIKVDDCTVTMRSRYVLSGADINVKGTSGSLMINNGEGTDSSWRSDAECDVWFENLVVDSKSDKAVDITANVYALDDFVINGAGSKSTIRGNYYGYNDGKFSVKNPNAGDSAASSLIVNANNATVSMNYLNTFVMLGNAYINHASKDLEVIDANEDKYIPTNESVAVSSDQEIYLVPTEFLDRANPYVSDSEMTVDPFKVNIPDGWFGYKYLAGTEDRDNSIAADSSKKYYKTVFAKKGSTYIAYCYLNFKDDEKLVEDDSKIEKKSYRQKYVDEIIPHVVYDNEDKVSEPNNTGVKPTAKDLYDRLKKTRDLQNSKISIGGKNKKDGSRISDEKGVHIYSPYGIVQNEGMDSGYDSDTIMMKSNIKGIERFYEYRNNMYKKYKWFDTYLDPQENRSLVVVYTYTDSTGREFGGNKNWDFKEVPTEDYSDTKSSSSDADDNGLPLSRLIWIGKIKALSENTEVKDADGLFPTSDVRVYNGDYTLNDSFNGFLLVNGDVTVNSATVNGFIYATGKVTFNGNCEVKYNSTLLERRIDDEIKAVKDAYSKNKKATGVYKDYYLINYLLKIGTNASASTPAAINGKTKDPDPKYDLKYYYGGESGAEEAVEINTDYRNYVAFENWENGQIQE